MSDKKVGVGVAEQMLLYSCVCVRVVGCDVSVVWNSRKVPRYDSFILSICVRIYIQSIERGGGGDSMISEPCGGVIYSIWLLPNILYAAAEGVSYCLAYYTYSVCIYTVYTHKEERVAPHVYPDDTVCV